MSTPEPFAVAVAAPWHRFLEEVEPLRPQLYRYCRYLTRSPWDAEDLVQDVLARAFVTLGCVSQRIENPRAWLFRVASNLWLNQVRRTRRPAELAGEPPSTEPQATREAAGTLLVTLAPRERAAVVLKDDRELLSDRGSFHEPEDITCEAVCIAELPAPPSDFVTVRSCTFDIDGYTSPGSGETDEVRDYTEVGRVACAGKIQPECAGRRPLGHIEARDVAGDALGRCFALFAHLEAASVVAFLELRRQLTAWGAPRQLIERCEAAALDEVRHAVMMTRFARAHGASVPVVRRSPCAEDLLAVALHNAVEGCVNETWAALVAHVQARHAQDPDVRAAYTSIAADETRHAQLAWDLHAWFMSLLGDEDCRAVALAQRRAVAALPNVGWTQAQGLPRELGLPEPDLAAAMARDFGHRLVA